MRKWGILWLLPVAVFAAQPLKFSPAITFEGESQVALKLLHNAFHSVGYKLDVRNLSVASAQGRIEGEAVGLRPFAVDAFAENLKEEGALVADAGSARGALRLNLDARNGFWNLAMIGVDEGVQLERSAAPVWFRVENGQTLRIEAPYVGKWYPDIAVLDRSFRVLSTYRSPYDAEEYEFPLPEGAHYLKVSNLWGMKGVGEGMWIESKSPGR